MNILFILICFSHFFIILRSQCLLFDIYDKCIRCLPQYYDTYYLDYLTVSPSNNPIPHQCVLKQNISLNRQIFINSDLPTPPQYNSSKFDQTYGNLTEGLIEESKLAVLYISSNITFVLQSGTHYVLKNYSFVSGPEIFRNSMVDIMITSFDESIPTNIIFKTSEFFFFISKSFFLNNIDLVSDFIFLDNFSNDISACYNQIQSVCCAISDYDDLFNNDNASNDSNCSLRNRIIVIDDQSNNYGLLNVEFLPNNTVSIIPQITIYNCSVDNFFPIWEVGFVSFLSFTSVFGEINLIYSKFMNFFFPIGWLSYQNENVDPNQFGDFEQGSIIVINESIFQSYNIYNISVVSLYPYSFINLENFKGNLMILNSQFENFNYGDYFLDFSNDNDFLDNLTLQNVTMTAFSEINLLNLGNLYNVSIYNLELNNINITQNGNYLFDVENIEFFEMNQTTFEGFNCVNDYLMNFFQTEMITFENIFMITLDLLNNLFYLEQGNFILTNCSFISSSFGQYIFYAINSTELVVNCTNFLQITGTNTMFHIDSTVSFSLCNTDFNEISFQSIYELLNLIFNFNIKVNFLNNSLGYLWQQDPQCNNIILESSNITNNIFTTGIFFNYQFAQSNFIQKSTQIIDNQIIEPGRELFIFFYGIIIFANSQIINNIFIDNDYCCIADFESDAQVLISGCYFEGNGLQELGDNEYCVLSVFLMDSLVIKSSFFVISETNEVMDGFICGFPFGNYLQLSQSYFIILDPLPYYLYKGFIIEEANNIIMDGNTFVNLATSSAFFYTIHGGLFIYASSNYLYVQNNYTCFFQSNVFINCSGIMGGGIMILSVKASYFHNCSFFNSSAEDFGGHLTIIAGETFVLENSSFFISTGNLGTGIYLWNILFCNLTNNNLMNGYSLNKGSLFLRQINTVNIIGFYSNDTFSESDAGLVYVFNCMLIRIREAVFMNCQSGEFGGCFFLQGSTTIFLENLTFISCLSNDGGGIYGDTLQQLIISNCSFFNSTSIYDGAGVYLNDVNLIYIFNILIQSSMSINSNGIIYVVGDNENSLLIMNKIVCNNNSAIQGSCLYLINSCTFVIFDLKINECMNNSLYSDSFFLISAYIINISLINCNSLEENMVYFNEISTVIENFHIQNCFGTKSLISIENVQLYGKNWVSANLSGYYIIESISSMISLKNLTFFNYGDNQNEISLISLQESNFSLNFSMSIFCFSQYDQNIYSENGEVSISNSFFANYLGTVIYNDQSNFFISNTVFFNNTNYSSTQNEMNFVNDGLTLNEIMLKNIKIIIFQGISSSFQGLFEIVISDSTLQGYNNMTPYNFDKNGLIIYNVFSIIIINSIFKYFHGSAIQISNDYSKSTQIFLMSSFFGFNKANEMSCLYFFGLLQISIQNSTFSNNDATFINPDQSFQQSIKGIGNVQILATNNSFLKLKNNTFYQNFADIAPNIFSLISISNDENNVYEKCNDSLNFSKENLMLPLKLICLNSTNITIASGQAIQLSLQTVDLLNQTANFDNLTLLTINQNLEKTSTSTAVKIINSRSQTNQGVTFFSDLIIYADPQSSFTITVDGLFMAFQDISIDLNYDIEIYSRACIIGEIIKSDSSCYACPPGMYSLKDPMAIENKYMLCSLCPINAICFGMDIIYPLTGYYRLTNNSIEMVSCIIDGSCLGYLENSTNINGDCLIGNYGVLCFYCEKDFGRNDEQSACSNCSPNLLLLYVRLIFYSLAILLYILWNNRILEKHVPKGEEEMMNFGQLFKILVNHNQQAGIIIFSFGKAFLDIVSDLINVYSFVTFHNSAIISNDCVMEMIININSEYILYYKTLLNTLLPLIFSMITFLIWKIFMTLRYILQNTMKNSQTYLESKFSQKLRIFLVISTYIFYPLIVKSCVALFDCQKLESTDEKTYLTTSPELECWSATHFTYILISSLPGLILFGVLFPLYFAYVLLKPQTVLIISQKDGKFKARKSQIDVKEIPKLIKLNSMKEKDENYVVANKMLVFFYKDYKTSYKYWECVIFFRKFSLSFISSLSQTIGPEYAPLLLLIILFLNLWATLNMMPFKLYVANVLETISLSLLILLVFLNTFRADIANSFIVEILIIILNWVFILISLGWLMLKKGKIMLEKRKGNRIGKPDHFKDMDKNFRMNFFGSKRNSLNSSLTSKKN